MTEKMGGKKSRSKGMNPELRARLGQNLRMARNVEGYTQEQIAEVLDVSVDNIWRWEEGRSAPMIDRLVRLSEIYQVSVDWLLGIATAKEADQARLIKKIMDATAEYSAEQKGSN